MTDETEGPAVQPRRASSRNPVRRWDPSRAGQPGYPATEAGWLSRQAAARERTLKLIAEGRWFRRGVPDGFKGRKVEVQEIRRRAKVEAKQLVSHMKKNGLTLDDQRAEDAMESMVEVVRAADDNGAYIHPVQYRIAAARAILDFTKQRPASKAEVALTKAEDFLAAVAAEVKGK